MGKDNISFLDKLIIIASAVLSACQAIKQVQGGTYNAVKDRAACVTVADAGGTGSEA